MQKKKKGKLQRANQKRLIFNKIVAYAQRQFSTGEAIFPKMPNDKPISVGSLMGRLPCLKETERITESALKGMIRDSGLNESECYDNYSNMLSLTDGGGRWQIEKWLYRLDILRQDSGVGPDLRADINTTLRNIFSDIRCPADFERTVTDACLNISFRLSARIESTSLECVERNCIAGALYVYSKEQIADMRKRTHEHIFCGKPDPQSTHGENAANALFDSLFSCYGGTYAKDPLVDETDVMKDVVYKMYGPAYTPERLAQWLFTYLNKYRIPDEIVKFFCKGDGIWDQVCDMGYDPLLNTCTKHLWFEREETERSGTVVVARLTLEGVKVVLRHTFDKHFIRPAKHPVVAGRSGIVVTLMSGIMVNCGRPLSLKRDLQSLLEGPSRIIWRMGQTERNILLAHVQATDVTAAWESHVATKPLERQADFLGLISYVQPEAFRAQLLPRAEVRGVYLGAAGQNRAALAEMIEEQNPVLSDLMLTVADSELMELLFRSVQIHDSMPPEAIVHKFAKHSARELLVLLGRVSPADRMTLLTHKTNHPQDYATVHYLARHNAWAVSEYLQRYPEDCMWVLKASCNDERTPTVSHMLVEQTPDLLVTVFANHPDLRALIFEDRGYNQETVYHHLARENGFAMLTIVAQLTGDPDAQYHVLSLMDREATVAWRLANNRKQFDLRIWVECLAPINLVRTLLLRNNMIGNFSLAHSLAAEHPQLLLVWLGRLSKGDRTAVLSLSLGALGQRPVIGVLFERITEEAAAQLFVSYEATELKALLAPELFLPEFAKDAAHNFSRTPVVATLADRPNKAKKVIPLIMRLSLEDQTRFFNIAIRSKHIMFISQLIESAPDEAMVFLGQFLPEFLEKIMGYRYDNNLVEPVINYCIRQANAGLVELLSHFSDMSLERVLSLETDSIGPAAAVFIRMRTRFFLDLMATRSSEWRAAFLDRELAGATLEGTTTARSLLVMEGDPDQLTRLRDEFAIAESNPMNWLVSRQDPGSVFHYMARVDMAELKRGLASIVEPIEILRLTGLGAEEMTVSHYLAAERPGDLADILDHFIKGSDPVEVLQLQVAGVSVANRWLESHPEEFGAWLIHKPSGFIMNFLALADSGLVGVRVANMMARRSAKTLLGILSGIENPEEILRLCATEPPNQSVAHDMMAHITSVELHFLAGAVRDLYQLLSWRASDAPDAEAVVTTAARQNSDVLAALLIDLIRGASTESDIERALDFFTDPQYKVKRLWHEVAKKEPECIMAILQRLPQRRNFLLTLTRPVIGSESSESISDILWDESATEMKKFIGGMSVRELIPLFDVAGMVGQIVRHVMPRLELLKLVLREYGHAHRMALFKARPNDGMLIHKLLRLSIGGEQNDGLVLAEALDEEGFTSKERVVVLSSPVLSQTRKSLAQILGFYCGAAVIQILRGLDQEDLYEILMMRSKPEEPTVALHLSKFSRDAMRQFFTHCSLSTGQKETILSSVEPRTGLTLREHLENSLNKRLVKKTGIDTHAEADDALAEEGGAALQPPSKSRRRSHQDSIGNQGETEGADEIGLARQIYKAALESIERAPCEVASEVGGQSSDAGPPLAHGYQSVRSRVRSGDGVGQRFPTGWVKPESESAEISVETSSSDEEE